MIKEEMRAKKLLLDRASAQADLGINELRASSTILFLVAEKASGIFARVSKSITSAKNNMTQIGEDVNFY